MEDSMTTTTKFHWFWAWDDEKEEAWLRQMALDGWHLQRMGFPSFYTFEQGGPRDVAYRLDFFTGGKDKANYLQLFSDAGWEHVGEYGSWQYFRKEATGGEAPEIFTDNESKVKKYQRVLAVLAFSCCMLAVVMSNPATNPEGPFFDVLTIVLFLFIVLMFYGIAMLLRRIKQLRR
jgi:hypothetical protein